MGVKVRQKKKGKGQPWWVFVTHDGRRTSKRVGDKKAAEEVARQIEAQLALGNYSFEPEKPPATFKEYADSWINVTVPATCKKSTLQDYKDILRIHVNPVFGECLIADITRGKIKDFLLEKSNSGYAPSTVTHIKNVLSGILNKALDDEAIPANPVHGLGKFIKKQDVKKKIDPLSQSELTKLLNAVAEHYPDHYTLFLVLARTGMRIGEALALQWSDINFAERYIEIKRSLVRGRISTPKSGKSRKVDMSIQLRDALRNYMKRFALADAKDVTQYVFTNTEGGLIDKNNWRPRVYNKAFEKTEIRRRRIHDLRHTYATLRISKGDNIGDVSNQLGHHSVKLTLDIYYHWIPGKKKAEVDALDDPALKIPSAPHLHPTPIKNKKGVAVAG